LAAGRDDPVVGIVEGAGGNTCASREWLLRRLRIWKGARSTEICVFPLMCPIPYANRVFCFCGFRVRRMGELGLRAKNPVSGGRFTAQLNRLMESTESFLQGLKPD